MANEQNLIPFNRRTEKDQRRIRSMGGKVKSKNKVIAAKLRELKKKGMTNESAKRMYDMMVEHDIADMKILSLIDEIEKQAKQYQDKSLFKEAIRLRMEWRRMRFGTKQRVEQKVDVNSTSVNFTFEMPKEFKEENTKKVKEVKFESPVNEND